MEFFLGSRAAAPVAAVALAISAVLTIVLLVGNDFIDLRVYRVGAQVLLDGGDIYGALPPVVGDFRLPFTYPPIAAMLFAPLTVIPFGLGKLVFTLVSVVALAVTLRVVLDRVWPQLGPRAAWSATVIAVALALQLEPVRETISFGQINMVLMALVAVDMLTNDPRWPRGLLIGLAAAIKLTPIGFLLLFLVKRDWRTSAHIVGAALGFTALALVVMPQESAKYWSQTLPDTGRIGPAYFANNESFKAVISRFGPPEHIGSVLWLVAVAVMLAVAAIAIWRALAHDDLVLAALANATAILLASPVSWSHHWVWAAPALLVLTLGALRAPSTWNVFAANGIGALFLIGPQHLLPTAEDRELDWALWQHGLGTLYVTAGFGFLLWLAFGASRSKSTTGELNRGNRWPSEPPADASTATSSQHT
ncbi:glycosyltransferase 87 family protein [Rhodococcus rhodnii]|uniref:Integral membrane protein n=1 Tax=Rhodococcus rhodnii LMG 5362 TaxID=1273125 RepID=R7WK33_9NOCA|nr:glycosyltransferase 87 family protein [Rhodococcus rhodnii]EOM74334.1 integral membrane protein [Rhodococcus rhodnii LMG 5362]